MSQHPLWAFWPSTPLWHRPFSSILCHCSLFSRCVKKNNKASLPTSFAPDSLNQSIDQPYPEPPSTWQKRLCKLRYFLYHIPPHLRQNTPHQTLRIPRIPRIHHFPHFAHNLRHHQFFAGLLSFSDGSLELTVAPVSPASMSADLRGWLPVQIWASSV